MSSLSGPDNCCRRIVLRADAGSRIGFGHYVRTIALAAYLKDDFDVRVATRNPDEGEPCAYQRQVAADAGVALLPLKGAARETFDPDFIAALRKDDIAVLDNYYYSTEYQTAVRNACHALVCIDDVHDRHFTADLLMTFCPLKASDFSMEPYTRFRGGLEWSFLRAPFLTDAKRPEERKLMNPGKFAIAMGGADPCRLTDKIVGILRRILPDAEIEVVAGDTVKIGFAPDARTRIHRRADAATMARIFDNADLGIFPASTVCVEAMARRLPIAAGHFVDNQKEIYEYGVGHGLFAPLGSLLDEEAILEERLRKIVTNRLPAPCEVDFAAKRNDIIQLFKTL